MEITNTWQNRQFSALEEESNTEENLFTTKAFCIYLK